MIKSMTGFGRGEWQGEGKRLEVEIKSFNHRFCDIVTHLPRKLSSLEPRLRAFLKQRLSRGRIEVFVQVDESSLDEQRLEIDLKLAKDYYGALRRLKETLGIPGAIQIDTMTVFREIFTRKDVEVDIEKEWVILQKPLEGALTGLERMRREEGQALREDFLQRLCRVEGIVAEVEKRGPNVLEACRDRLTERVRELSGGLPIDPARLAQEVAFLAERADITEELVRIRSHVSQFREMLGDPEPMGRKLDFLLQEINREVNTIGSKANDAPSAQLVVEIKSELEKMREQVQNVE